MLGRSPEDVATFLAKAEGLDKTLIGDYLGEREDFNLKVMHAYVDALDFSGLEFDMAIRTFLQVGGGGALVGLEAFSFCFLFMSADEGELGRWLHRCS